MVITIDATSAVLDKQADSNPSSYTINITIGSNSNRALILSYGYYCTTPAIVASVKIGSTDFTLIKSVVQGNVGGRAEAWILLNPPTGAQTITITFIATPGLVYMGAAAISLYNVDQVTGTGVTVSATGSTFTAITPTSAGSWIFNQCLTVDGVAPTGASNTVAWTPTLYAGAQYNSSPTIGAGNNLTWSETSAVYDASVGFELLVFVPTTILNPISKYPYAEYIPTRIRKRKLSRIRRATTRKLDFKMKGGVIQHLKTFTLDLIADARHTKTFTLDILAKKKNNTKTFTVDLLAKNLTILKEFTLNLLTKKKQTTTFIMDLVVAVSGGPKTFTIDLLAKATSTKTFTANLLAKINNQINTFTINVLSKKKGFTSTFTIDIICTKPNTKIFNIDIIVKTRVVNILDILQVRRHVRDTLQAR
jgi:hypothetical protein